jgi:hypothetical protein
VVVLTNYHRYGVLPGNNINSGPGFVTADGLKWSKSSRANTADSSQGQRWRFALPLFFPKPKNQVCEGHMSDTADAATSDERIKQTSACKKP